MTVERIIDSHQHFFDPERGDYPWMEEPPYAPIRKVWTPQDFLSETAGIPVAHSVLVQTWSSVEETEEFLRLASRNEFIAGVVGWVDLADANVSIAIEGLLTRDGGGFLKGVRHQVHDEPDPEWLLRSDVRRGIEAVGAADLVYDLLVKPRELSAALETVRSFPSQRFVIDHMGKPEISRGMRDEWLALLTPFADLQNVACKVSGIVTEAVWDDWDEEELSSYARNVIDIFGPDRAMFGSDWPVCRVAASYEQVVDIVRNAVASLPPADRDSVLWLSAERWYRLEL
jgi:L-fuconolactonase